MSDPMEKRVAYVLLRLMLGINLFGHGFIRVLHGPGNFAAGMVKTMAEALLPAGIVYLFGICVPWIEIVLGLALIAGLGTRWVLIAASLLMSVLMIGITLKQDWPTAGLQLGYGLVIFTLMILRADYDIDWGSIIRVKGS